MSVDENEALSERIGVVRIDVDNPIAVVVTWRGWLRDGGDGGDHNRNDPKKTCKHTEVKLAVRMPCVKGCELG